MLLLSGSRVGFSPHLWSKLSVVKTMPQEYDDTAFYYFAISMLCIFLIPDTLSVISRIGSKLIWTGRAEVKVRGGGG
jgi:hypothetical protein